MTESKPAGVEVNPADVLSPAMLEAVRQLVRDEMEAARVAEHEEAVASTKRDRTIEEAEEVSGSLGSFSLTSASASTDCPGS